MGRRSKVLSPPRDVRTRLDALIIERGFGDYAGLADWLAGEGHPIGKSALHKYGQGLERRIEQIRLATEQAEALVAAAPDDQGALADASMRLVQERIFEVMLAAEADDGHYDLKALASAARSLAETARASTTVRQERRKVLREIAEQVRRAEAEEPDAEAAWVRIRRDIYGLAA